MIGSGYIPDICSDPLSIIEILRFSLAYESGGLLPYQ